MTAAALGIIAATVLATSFLSGIFGMAGGLILLGVLLIWLDVAPAMVLFGAIQTTPTAGAPCCGAAMCSGRSSGAT